MSQAAVRRADLDAEEAAHLCALFKVLANETRLRLVHALIEAGEMSVGDLAAMLGMSSQAVSNQLQRLIDREIVAARRDGNRMYYRVIDPCVRDLLREALCLADQARSASDSTLAPPRAGEDSAGLA